MGMIILVGMSYQPITEIVNHFLYRKYPNVRYLAYVHLWLGRLLITMGMVNGALGFTFAETIPYQKKWSVVPQILYGVVAIGVWMVYFVFSGVWQQLNLFRRPQRTTLVVEEMENLRRQEENELAGAEVGMGSRPNFGAFGEEQRRRGSPKPESTFRSNAL
jgi:hypothetical protein